MCREADTFDPLAKTAARLRDGAGCAGAEIRTFDGGVAFWPQPPAAGRAAPSEPLCDWFAAAGFSSARPMPPGIRVQELSRAGDGDGLEALRQRIQAAGFRPCRLVLLAGDAPLAAAWLGCRKRGDPCPPETAARAFEPLLQVLEQREAFLRERVPAGLLRQLIRELECAAFVTRADGRPLWWNAAADSLARRPPRWMIEGAFRDDGSWIRLPFCCGADEYWLLLSKNGSTPVDAAQHSDWAARFGLAPRLARAAALLLRGCTDKEIASRLGLSHHTARTYVKEILARSGSHTRHGFVAKALSGL